MHTYPKITSARQSRYQQDPNQNRGPAKLYLHGSSAHFIKANAQHGHLERRFQKSYSGGQAKFYLPRQPPQAQIIVNHSKRGRYGRYRYRWWLGHRWEWLRDECYPFSRRRVVLVVRAYSGIARIVEIVSGVRQDFGPTQVSQSSA